MVRKRNSTMEHKIIESITMADKLKESRKGQVSGYPVAGESKQNNGHAPLSKDMETSTGDVISPNGIRLWGMW